MRKGSNMEIIVGKDGVCPLRDDNICGARWKDGIFYRCLPLDIPPECPLNKGEVVVRRENNLLEK